MKGKRNKPYQQAVESAHREDGSAHPAKAGSRELDRRTVKPDQADFIRDLGKSLYEYHDRALWGLDPVMRISALSPTRSIDDLMTRDKQREDDGFPRKIRLGKMTKPGGKGDDRVVVVPTTVEEKLLHDEVRLSDEEEGEGGDEQGQAGHGDGDEGDIIGEQPIRESGPGEGGAGQGDGGAHDIESNAYDLGRVLTEEFRLPNLKDKGKKRSLSKYSYELTDQNRGFGQIIDKKRTLKRIIRTNIGLERIGQGSVIDGQSLLVSPNDRVYRILSREKDYESQAVVFFVRDYSGSMSGKPTELVVSQHVMIYSWLIYQYESQVETRFILHDTEAKEVDNFSTYYNSTVAGGTQVSSAYRLVNKIVAKEQLERDYNIYVFHGTDGDDWDLKGDEAIPELKTMLTYVNRVGISIAENSYGVPGKSEVERYIRKSGLLEEKPELIKLDVLGRESTETRLIDGIRALIS